MVVTRLDLPYPMPTADNEAMRGGLTNFIHQPSDLVDTVSLIGPTVLRVAPKLRH